MHGGGFVNTNRTINKDLRFVIFKVVLPDWQVQQLLPKSPGSTPQALGEHLCVLFGLVLAFNFQQLTCSASASPS